MKHIFIVCDDPSLNTGYARVGRFVAKTLVAAGYKVTYLPCNAMLPGYDYSELPYTVESYQTYDRYWVRRAPELLAKYKPSCVLVFGEFLLVGHMGMFSRDAGITSVYYMPVEG